MTDGHPALPRGALASRRTFASRVGRMAILAVALVVATLAIGTVGYHAVDGFPWLDAFHQSAMLLSGMGPVRQIETTAGKLFDSFYALLCALVMLGAAGILFAPIVHRLLHRFHLEDAGPGR